MNKKMMLPVALFAATVGTVGMGVSLASAHQGNSGMAAKVASQFNLNQSEVEQFFSQNREEMQKEREAKHEAELQKLVDEGKLTLTQKAALIAKRAEMKGAHEANNESKQVMSQDERKALHEERKAEMDAWFQSQGIDPTVLPFGGKNGGHGAR